MLYYFNRFRQKVLNKIKNERANAVVENVIVLPLVLIVLILIIVMVFVVHDKSTVESAARRGAIYAAHCISNPSYSSILQNSNNQKGSLDSSVNAKDNAGAYTFTGIGSNIKPYRYLKSKDRTLETKVNEEVRAIIENTRIPWRNIDIDKIEFIQKNAIYYQDVTVKITVNYELSPVFKVVGMEHLLTYETTAKMTVNDPDEFVRNADLVVDLVVEVDKKLGGKISSLTDKIKRLGAKVIEWTSMD